MKIYSYRIDHDYGLAPNPFGGYCTIAVCKPNIRKSSNLKIDDWLIGTGSKSLEHTTGFECISKLIFAMQVTEIMDLNSYWNDKRFQYKKPQMNGTLSSMFGDNCYYLNDGGDWAQVDCAHRNLNGKYNQDLFRKDIEGRNVIISNRYYYFGDCAPEIPDEIIAVCHSTQGQKIVRPEELSINFLNWLHANFQEGVNGLPINWVNF